MADVAEANMALKLKVPAMPAKVPIAAAEFVGTMFLVLAVCYSSGAGVYGPIAVGFVLMVLIYALGRVSGGKFNPAVSATLLLSQKTDVKTAILEIVSQFLGGYAAVRIHDQVHGSAYTPVGGAAVGYENGDVLMVEAAYTALLCLTVCLSAVSKMAEGKQYFGLAIGGTVIVGGNAIGAISGGHMNPAISFALTSGNSFTGLGAYLGGEFAGCAAAALLFRLMSPMDFGGAEDNDHYPGKVLSEAYGTFMLMLTVGLSVSSGGQTGLAVGIFLMSMIYNVGQISGCHINPAVTMGIFLSGRGAMPVQDMPLYIALQIGGAIGAGVMYPSITDTAFKLALNVPGATAETTKTESQIMVAEGLLTMIFVFVIITTTNKVMKADFTSDFAGLAIGGTLAAAATVCGPITGGVINPAVAVGINFADSKENAGATLSEGLMTYMAGQFGGVLAAIILYAIIYNNEFHDEPTPDDAPAASAEEGDMAMEDEQMNAMPSASSGSSGSSNESSEDDDDEKAAQAEDNDDEDVIDPTLEGEAFVAQEQSVASSESAGSASTGSADSEEVKSESSAGSESSE